MSALSHNGQPFGSYIIYGNALNRLVKKAHHELIITEVGTTEAKQILSHVPVDGVIAVDSPEQVEASSVHAYPFASQT